MRDFRKLEVWRKAMDLVVDVYKLTRCFPDDERFGMTAQTRRASVSVPANIAEGCGRSTDRELARDADMASGSTSELECYLILAKRLDWIRDGALETRAQEVRRMHHGLLNKLRPSS